MNIKPCWKVTAVQARPSYFLRLEFENGERRVMDAAPLLASRSFHALRDRKVFLAAKAEEGGVLWGDGIELAPELLYANSRPL